MTQITLGVDISKDTLDVYRLPDGQRRRFANDAPGYKALIAFIGKEDVGRVVFEPTGPYHRALEAALAKKELPFVKVNPRQARRFAEATGKLAKTDRIDAANLARMGALLDLGPSSPRSEILCELKELYIAREALVKDRTAAKNREKQLTLPLLKRQNGQRLAQIQRQIEAVEAEIEARVQADPNLGRRLEVVTSIPGISTITAFTLIIEMPELGTLDGKQAVRPLADEADPLFHGYEICFTQRPPVVSAWRSFLDPIKIEGFVEKIGIVHGVLAKLPFEGAGLMLGKKVGLGSRVIGGLEFTRRCFAAVGVFVSFVKRHGFSFCCSALPFKAGFLAGRQEPLPRGEQRMCKRKAALRGTVYREHSRPKMGESRLQRAEGRWP